MFFGCLLLTVIVNLLKNLGSGAEMYADAKRSSDLAIAEYDQAIIDLTASILSGKIRPDIFAYLHCLQI